jgi:uncharacterized protein (TIGR02996 family)
VIPPGEPNPELYQAVVADPDNDLPRLTYADWFERHGQPERAGFIRLQCRAAQLPERHPERTRLEREADQGASRHRVEWLRNRPVPEGVDWHFLRGFPERVVFRSFASLESARDKVFSYFVRRIGFNDLRSIPRLAGCPDLASIRELDLSGCTVREAGVQVLGQSPYLTRLTWLALRGCNLGTGGPRLLAEWPALAGLRHLDLARTNLGNDGVAALARSPHLGELTSLSLTANRIEPVGFRALAEAGCWPRLQVLFLDRCGIAAEAFAELARCRQWTDLSLLDLSGNGIDGRGMQAPAEARCWPRLRVLLLQGNRLGTEGAEELARCRQWADLEVLDLFGNSIKEAGGVVLARAEHFTRLQILRLTRNAVGDDTAAALADSPTWNRLHALALNENVIRDEGAWALGRSSCLHALRDLALTGNAVRPDLLGAVVERFRDQDPQRLDRVPAQAPVSELPDLPPPPPLPSGHAPADEEGIVQAIIEAPDDNIPRLIYADWLEEHGHPERAELVRLQCSPEPDCRQRLPGLLEEHAPRWLGPLAEEIERYRFDRGMLLVTVSMRTFMSRRFQEQAVGWFRAARVHGLILQGTTAYWEKVAGSSLLAAVHELELNGNGLGDAGLGKVLGSAHLSGLHTLAVSNNMIRVGLTALAGASLPRLRRLTLSGNSLGHYPPSVQALAGWPQTRWLTSLNLEGNYLRYVADQLFASPQLAGLVRLNLARNYFGDAGVGVLASSPYLSTLQSLNLEANGVGNQGARLLAGASLPALKELNLRANPVGDEGALALAHSPLAEHLHRLSLWTHLSQDCLNRLREVLGERVVVSR